MALPTLNSKYLLNSYVHNYVVIIIMEKCNNENCISIVTKQTSPSF